MKRIVVAALVALAALTAAPVDSASADTVRDGQWYLSALGVQQAWRTTRGAGVTVCVIDSGIDAEVPDLQGAVVGRRQFTKYVDGDGLVTSHGTGVASVLAGRGHGRDGSDGVIGIAPQARLLDAVVGDTDPNIDQQAADAIRWCTADGASVINMSFALLSDGPISAAIAYAQAKDVVVVAASSNTFENLRTDALPNPAGVPGVLAVTGIDKTLRHDDGAFDSTRGKAVSLAAPFSTTSGANGNPDIGLPVADVRTAVANGRPYAQHACGTSYSSPIVAGTAALIRAAHPSMTADDVIAALLASATPTGTGRPNRTYGWGILDVAAAVGADLQPATGNPVVTGTIPAPKTTTAPTTRAPATAAPTTAASTTAASTTRAPAISPSSPRAASSSDASTSVVWISVLAIVVAGAGAAAAIALRRRSTR